MSPDAKVATYFVLNFSSTGHRLAYRQYLEMLEDHMKLHYNGLRVAGWENSVFPTGKEKSTVQRNEGGSIP